MSPTQQSINNLCSNDCTIDSLVVSSREPTQPPTNQGNSQLIDDDSSIFDVSANKSSKID